MNGAQDLGGQMGFGPVQPEADEPVFHAEWEKRALGLTLAAGALGHWCIDESRHARETLHPLDYLSASYYEIWIRGLERLLAQKGLVTGAELQAGRCLQAPVAAEQAKALRPEDVAGMLARGGPTERHVEGTPRFRVGDRVRTINDHPTGHCRLPRYARGRTGTIERVHGAHVFPDTSAHGRGEHPQWLYTVAFGGRELWGRAADPTLTVSVDAWQDYLEPA